MSKVFGPMEALGIEMEYMLVNAEDLSVAPVADKIFTDIVGEPSNEVEGEELDWSNELVRHVVEIKNPKPTSAVNKLSSAFRKEIGRLWTEAEKKGCLLLPTAMHPWMNPEKEAQLWPHAQKQIYETYDRIFQCKGHGWSNLQSTHINLSFGKTDSDFGRLHAALRAITPLIPIIASSSPFQEGQRGPYLSTRLHHYFQNQRRIPSIIGPIIPEPVWTIEDYENQILKPMYKEIAPYDTESVLQEDWLNSRAVIAKFDYNRFEIRVMDIQECPEADLALCWFFIELAKKLYHGSWASPEELQSLSSDELRHILNSAAKEADQCLIDNPKFLQCFGLRNPKINGLELLRYLFSEIQVKPEDKILAQNCESLLRRGPLSRCMINALGDTPHRESLKEFYSQLSKSLIYGQIYSE